MPISYDRFLTALGYYRKVWCFNRIYCHVHQCAWYMGHTRMCQIHTTVFWQLVVTIQNDNVSIESVFMFNIWTLVHQCSGCGLCDMVLNIIALDHSTNYILQHFFSSVALQAMNFLHFYTMISFGGFLAECLPCYRWRLDTVLQWILESLRHRKLSSYKYRS